MTRKTPFRIVFLGGGLSNCIAIRLVHDLLSCGNREVQLVMISSWNVTYYSAMLPSLICGNLLHGQNSIDLRLLCAACDVEFLLGTVTKIDPLQRKCFIDTGAEVSYDAISINIGSRTRGTESLPGASEWGLMPRPVNVFLQKVGELDLFCRGKSQPRLIVVGSGISGLELACSLKQRVEAHMTCQVQTIILDKYSESGREKGGWERAVMRKTLLKFGVVIEYSCVAKRVSGPGQVELQDGRVITGDILTFATGPEPHPLDTGLEMCDKGFILVTQYLQSVSYENVFAAGDCVTIKELSNYLPKTGVHAIREGPILALNLISYIKTHLFDFPLSLLKYSPSPDYLQIIDLGNGVGLALAFGMTFAAKWALALKRAHDTAFILEFTPEALLGTASVQKYRIIETCSHDCGKAIPDDAYLLRLMRAGLGTEERSWEADGLTADAAVDVLLETTPAAHPGVPAQLLFRMKVDLQFRREVLNAYISAVA